MLHLKTIEKQFIKLDGAYAPTTIKSYYADVTHFVDWCDAKGVPAFPLDDCVLVEFIEAHQFAPKYATVRRKLAAFRRINSLLGCPDAVHSQEFHLALRRMRRGQSADRRQARGINEDLLLRMIAAQPSTLTGTRNRALLSLGYDFLGRPLCGRSVSNIVKLSVVKARGARPRECEVSGHSLRVGAAQDLLIRGHDISAIMRAGGWDSVRVVSNYLRLAEHNIWE